MCAQTPAFLPTFPHPLPSTPTYTKTKNQNTRAASSSDDHGREDFCLESMYRRPVSEGMGKDGTDSLGSMEVGRGSTRFVINDDLPKTAWTTILRRDDISTSGEQGHGGAEVATVPRHRNYDNTSTDRPAAATPLKYNVGSYRPPQAPNHTRLSCIPHFRHKGSRLSDPFCPLTSLSPPTTTTEEFCPVGIHAAAEDFKVSGELSSFLSSYEGRGEEESQLPHLSASAHQSLFVCDKRIIFIFCRSMHLVHCPTEHNPLGTRSPCQT